MPDFGPNWKWKADLPEGGQSHVFLVVHSEAPDGPRYALKRLKNLKRLDRFNREIEACQKLDSPNIVRIIAHEVDPKGRPFIVTEYCPGGALADRTPPLGSLPNVLQTFRQICAGVVHAHANGVIHRDLKPDNIYLREDGTPVVGDFGLCFVDNGGQLTQTEEVMGSRFYCAPELRDGHLPSGVPERAADVYSLGKVLYWMLTGRVFDREDHRLERYKLEGENPSGVEYELVNQLLDRTIVADPIRRYLGAELLFAAVEGLTRVVLAKGRAITLSVPHRCLFCAQGDYTVVVNTLNEWEPGGVGRSHIITKGRAHDLFGLQSTESPAWLILACRACGNVQIFRPDLLSESERAIEKWTGRVFR
ncbi:MAG TPA: serine/threonine-protein kinase [Acidobacteriaceae bacterium]|jgi:serine/threonine protein kinase|nr:serine/threonine-protein kinase [Acidobacteriaceae bacterium]